VIFIFLPLTVTSGGRFLEQRGVHWVLRYREDVMQNGVIKRMRKLEPLAAVGDHRSEHEVRAKYATRIAEILGKVNG
jgi:hypothetical protein